MIETMLVRTTVLRHVMYFFVSHVGVPLITVYVRRQGCTHNWHFIAFILIFFSCLSFFNLILYYFTEFSCLKSAFYFTNLSPY